MRLSATAVLLSSLPLLATAAPAASCNAQADHDAIIVGGGPSGLSALSGLARVRRNAFLIDSGEYRNGPTRHMHDVLGFDGVTPAYYRWAGRQQISHYKTVSMTNGTVTKIEPLQNNTCFRVTYAAGRGAAPTVKTARKIILATGIRDLVPNTPGVRENWGKGIYWCPWCDGNEHADQQLGLLAPLDAIPGLVREILTLNKDLVAFVNGTDTPSAQAATDKASPQWRDYLKIHNVRIDNRTITSLERTANGGDVHHDPSLPTAPEVDGFVVNFASGEPVTRQAFFTSFKSEQRSRVGEAMGVKLLGGRLTADGAKGLATNIPGVYAVGDANSDNSTNVPHALYSGKRTAVFVHVQLERETAAAELAAFAKGGKPAKRSIHEEARAVWNVMNGRSDEILHAGDFEQ